MASREELRAVRIEKLKRLKDFGMDPYPVSSQYDYTLADVASRFDALAEKGECMLVGRIMSLRPQGGLIFGNFNDGTGAFQALLREEDTDKKLFALFSDTVDIGDFVSFSGTLMKTKRGEPTILVKTWTMLSKSLLPLPEKWHGLSDVEERFRTRYLDTLSNPAVKERFVARSRIIQSLRSALDKAGYMEVETPMLQPHAGGATALPFVTHHEALDMDLYLRIAPELYLKQLLVGGFSKVYEIGRNFRNEGIDVTHNPEFTMLEFYESFSDSKKQLTFMEGMMRDLVVSQNAQGAIEYDGKTVDFSKPFARESYLTLLSEETGIKDLSAATADDIADAATKAGISVHPKEGKARHLDALFKRLVRPKLIAPTFVVDFPKEYLPLAKSIPGDDRLVDAFQLYAGGLELVKAFSELNDPLDQRSRFEQQEKERAAGDKEAQTTDESFLEALEHGMPPAGGVGIGIDRLVMLLTNTHNIREVIFFPTLRPKA